MSHQKYFFLFLFELILLIFIGKSTGFFTVINRYFYDLIAPSLIYPDQTHEKFTLVDASMLNDPNEINRSLLKIDSYAPQLIVVDALHQLQQKGLEELHLPKLHSKLFLSAPDILAQAYSKQSESIKVISYTHNSDTQKRFELTPYGVPPFPSTTFLSEENIWINFNGMPLFRKLSVEDILENSIVEEFFRDKIVILSTLPNVYAFPRSQYSNSNEAFLHLTNLAFLFKSGLNNSWIRQLSLESYYGFMLLCIIAVLTIFYFYSRHSTLLLISYVVVVCSLYWFFLSYLYFAIPLSDLIFLGFTASYLLLYRRQGLALSEEAKVLRKIDSNLPKKMVYASFFNSDNYWNEIINLVSELFILNKSIFLESVEGSNRIQEIISLNCGFEDVIEKRRDYTREPYHSAIKEKSVKQPNRQFFAQLDEDEAEFIAPLFHFNDLLGFWVFTIKKEHIYKDQQFLQDTTLCSREIGRLLHERARFKKQLAYRHKSIINKLDALMGLEYQNINAILTRNKLSIFIKKMYINNIVLDNIHTNIILYDFFGRVIGINEKMNLLLQKEGIKADASGASEMLSSLTQIDRDTAIKIIRKIIFRGTKHEQAISFKNSSSRYRLRISAITKDQIKNRFDDNFFTKIYGLMFEFQYIDYTEEILHNKESDTYDMIILHKTQQDELRKLLHQRLYEAGLDDIRKTKLNEDILKTIKKMEQSHAFLEAATGKEDAHQEEDIYPLDLMSVVHDACDSISEEYFVKQIRIELTGTTEPTYIRASRKHLYHYLKLLLEYLVDNNSENSVIQVAVTHEEEIVHLVLSGQEFGIPNEQLHTYFESDAVLDTDALHHDLEAWGGVFDLSGSIVEGIRFELKFPNFAEKAN